MENFSLKDPIEIKKDCSHSLSLNEKKEFSEESASQNTVNHTDKSVFKVTHKKKADIFAISYCQKQNDSKNKNKKIKEKSQVRENTFLNMKRDKDCLKPTIVKASSLLSAASSFESFNSEKDKNVKEKDNGKYLVMENLTPQFRKSSNYSMTSLVEEELEQTKTFTPKIIISSTENFIPSRKLGKRGTVNRADCIRKRIKTHFNQFLLKYLNSKVQAKFPLLGLGKLSQCFIADVKIESNKKYLSLPLRDVFSLDIQGAKNQENNKHVLKAVDTSEDTDLITLFNEPYFSFYHKYLTSDFYNNDLKKFIKKEGESYVNLFKKYSYELIDYYKKGTPYRRRSSASSNNINGRVNFKNDDRCCSSSIVFPCPDLLIEYENCRK